MKVTTKQKVIGSKASQIEVLFIMHQERQNGRAQRGSSMKEENDVDVWKNNVQQDIQEIKSKQNTMQENIHKLQLNDGIQDKEISTLHATLSSIQDDTRWIRRMITKAIVGTVITGVVGGAIAYFFTQI